MLMMRMNLPVRMKRFDFHCTYASVVHRRHFRVPPVLYDLRDSSFEPQLPNDDEDERPVRAHDIRRSRLRRRGLRHSPIRDENFSIIENGNNRIDRNIYRVPGRAAASALSGGGG
jgi:hypothetical protein